MKQIISVVLVLVLGSLACSLKFSLPPISLTPPNSGSSQTPFVIPPTTTPVFVNPTFIPTKAAVESQSPPASSNIPTLTTELIRNASFIFTGTDLVTRTITLQDGKFQQGTDPSQTGYVAISLGKIIAFGDLDHDGAEDAVVTIAENFGGSGVFVSVVAVLNQNGHPNPVSSAVIEDRPIINELTIKDGEIIVDATIHAPNDALCCPSVPSTRNLRLIDGGLVLTRFTTKTMLGSERSITIDSPINSTLINGPFVIRGSVTISPFENNLAYSVFRPGINEPVDRAGFMVNTIEMGGPGTFELLFDFSKTGIKGPIRIEIADFSAADGSYLAAATIFLIIQ